MFFLNSHYIINKIRSNKTLINGGLYTLFSFLNRGISFFLLILIAGYIGPGEYGYLSLYGTVVMFLGYFIDMSSSGYLSVSYFKDSREVFKICFTVIMIIITVITSFFFLLYYLISPILSSILDLPRHVLLIAIIVSSSGIIYNILQNIFRIKEIVLGYGVISITFALMNFLLTLFLVINLNMSWEGRIYAQLIGNLLFFTFAIFYFVKDGLFVCSGISSYYFKKMIFWGLPIIPHLASVWIANGCDKYILNSFHSIEDVGLFSFAFNLVSVISIIGGAFNATNSVTLAKIISNNNLSSSEKRVKLKKQTRMLFFIYLFVAVSFPIISYFLVILFLPNYQKSLPYFFILCLSGLMNCLYTLYCNYFFYFDKTKNLFIITFFSSLLHLLLSFWLTRYSIYFTSMIYVVCDTIVAYCVWTYSRKLLKIYLV